MDKSEAIAQLHGVLAAYNEVRRASQYDDLSDRPGVEITRLITLIAASIDRLAPPGSRYRHQAEDLLAKAGGHNPYTANLLLGVALALRADIEAGHMQVLHELIHAEIFGDFLEMAEYLLDEGYKDPAAVITGGVLEEHLRKLCKKNSIQTEHAGKSKKADTLNADLAGAGVYSKLDQKSVTAWLDLRNKAAHGKYSEYTKDQVALMLQGIRHFLTRLPA